MRKIIPALVSLFFATSSSAQHQVFELMERTDLSIYQVEQLANHYFDSAGTGRGTGYKQFQRWLYERKFHVDENGYYIQPQVEWNRFLQARGNMTETVNAGSWTPLGPSGWTYTSGWNPGTGRISAVAIHPANESIIYVGSPGGGLWKTNNGGANWIPLTDNNSTWMSVFALAIDPVNQDIVYMGTSTSLLLKSTDAGTTWNPTGPGPSGTIRKVLIHPSSTNIVFACASNGIFRSVNGGSSWTQVHSGSKEDIEFKPNDLNIMYASGSDVVRSTDMGLTWTPLGPAEGITNTGRTLVAVSPADPNVVYAVQASGSLFGRMYRSDNSGLNFITTVVGSPSSGTNYFGYEANGTGTSGQATYDMAMDVSPTDANDVYIAGIICWRSTNGGTSFSALTVWSYPNSTGYNHADVHGLFWINSTIYSISDGGIYKSIDHGDNWTDLSPGLSIRQFYRIALSQTDPNVITGGAQDNGSVTRQTGGNWVDWLGADGMEGLVSPTNHLRIWGTSQNGNLYRSINGGNSYTGLGRPSPGQWVTPLAIHPTNETILYGGWTGVYKSTNSGSSWTNISSGSISGTLADLTIAPSDPNYIYASNGATLWVTTNDGASWTTRSAPSVINDIAVDPTDPTKIWIACNSASNRVMVSTDAGATFTNISLNLPAIVARTVVVDDNTPRNIYVGMNIGVFHKTESAGSWTDFSDNLPLVAINELEIQKQSNKIRVATYGRGVWESPVADAPPGFGFTTPAPTTSSCPAAAPMNIILGTVQIGVFTNPITLSATAGVPAGTTVTFSTNPVTPGNSTVVTLNNPGILSPGTYIITITGTATGATTQTRDLTFIISPGAGPVINTQPASQTICSGNNAVFSVSATGALTYQWQVSPDCLIWTNLTNVAPYSGVTTPTLTITNAPASMNNLNYRVIVVGQCNTTNSAPCALLTVGSATVITSQPQDVTLCAGTSNTFCVTATGANLTYQWQSNPVGCSGPWTDIPAATSNCYISNTTTTTWFRCRVTGSCSPPVFSDCAVMNVTNTVVVSTQPSNATVCAGGNASFTVAGTGTGIIYQWQVNTGSGFVNIPSGAPYSGTTTATLTITGAGVSMNGYQYRAQLSNATCPTPGISNAATLTVNSLPAISSNPADATVCLGSTQTFSVTASGTGLTYQWQVSSDGGISYTDIGGANAASYTIPAVTTAMNNNRYRAIVSGTCTPSATSSSAILVVISPVTITGHPVNAQLCSGSNTSFSVTGAGVGIIYQWQVSTDGGTTFTNISGANGPVLNLTNVTASMNNNRYRALLSTPACSGATPSNAAILTVHQLPSIGLSAAPLTSLLPGQITTLTATPSPATGGVLSTTWLLNGTVFSNTGNTYVATIENPGNYQVRIQETWTDGSICTNQSPVVSIDAAISTRLFIFPSPNDGTFTVAYYNSSGTNSTRSVTVHDSKGAKVYSAKFQVSGPYTLMHVKISPVMRGVYYVVVGDVTGNKLAEGKVLVH